MLDYRTCLLPVSTHRIELVSQRTVSLVGVAVCRVEKASLFPANVSREMANTVTNKSAGLLTRVMSDTKHAGGFTGKFSNRIVQLLKLPIRSHDSTHPTGRRPTPDEVRDVISCDVGHLQRSHAHPERLHRPINLNRRRAFFQQEHRLVRVPLEHPVTDEPIAVAHQDANLCDSGGVRLRGRRAIKHPYQRARVRKTNIRKHQAKRFTRSALAR